MTWITPGKKYLTRDGRVARVTREGTISGSGVSERALFGTVEGIDHEVAWSLSGSWGANADLHPNDIMRVWKPPVAEVVDETKGKPKKKPRRK